MHQDIKKIQLMQVIEHYLVSKIKIHLLWLHMIMEILILMMMIKMILILNSQLKKIKVNGFIFISDIHLK